MRLQMHGLAGFFKNVINPFPTKPVVSEIEQSGTSTPKDESSNRPLTKDTIKAQPGKVTEKTESERPMTKVVEHDSSLNETRETVYDLIKDIRDPEKPQSLEELDVVSEENICVCQFDEESLLIQITFVPTVPHCSLASLIGLCLRQKLIQDFPEKHKLDIFVKEGSHETADDVNKQINDKERIAAALENPNLRELVDQCISNDFG